MTSAVRAASFSFTAVMPFEEAIRVCNCVYCGRLAGNLVRVLLPKLRTATGVVAGIFLMIVSMSASPSPWLEQSIVRVVLSPLVGRQVHGRMGAVGHLQLMAERETKGVAAWSLHVASTTKGDRVGSEMSQPSPPQPVDAPQSKGSTFGKEIQMN